MNRQRGFSLAELLLVVGLIAILATIVVVVAQRVQQAAREKLIVARLHELAELELQYRVTLGRRAYVCLGALQTAQTGTGLLVPTALTIPVPGWTINDSSDDANNCATTGSQFGFTAVPAPWLPDGTPRYCVYEDGQVRAQPNNGSCTRNSSAVTP